MIATLSLPALAVVNISSHIHAISNCVNYVKLYSIVSGTVLEKAAVELRYFDRCPGAWVQSLKPEVWGRIGPDPQAEG